jgi:heavy metal sensor kinase
MPSAALRRKEFFGSLRFRLTVWNTAVVLLMVIVTLWGVRGGLSLILWNEADKQLVEDAEEVARAYEHLYPNLDEIHAQFDRKAIVHTYRSLHIRIFDPQHELLWTSSVNAPEKPFSTKYLAYGLTPVTVEQYRLVHADITKAGIPPVTIRVGMTFAPLEEDIALITRLLYAVGSAALLVSPLGGFWLAGRATRPIAQIIDTTNRLRPTGLDERLPLRGTGDELDRLSATINSFLDRIAAYLRQNREFTANAAHELRSPLAAIQNSLEVSLSSDRSVEEYKEMLADLLDECAGLRGLVNQLLLLAESDSGRLQPGTENVPFDQVVQRGYDMFLGVAETARVEMRLGRIEPVFVSGDSGRLRQVVNNLLDNAIKYTGAGGTVLIGLRSHPEDGTARLTVRDSGIGIPADQLSHIFDRFFRVDKARQRDHQARGLGLGLAICQSIVATHGGRIEVESAIDRGTAFTVILPTLVAKPEPSASLAENGIDRTGDHKRNAQSQASMAERP